MPASTLDVTRTAGVRESANKPMEVFSIPELLETILLNTSQTDVFVVQRVCRTFNNTILGSKNLQRKMAFASFPDKNSWWPPSSAASYLHLGPYRADVDIRQIGPYLADGYSLPRESQQRRLDFVLEGKENGAGVIGWSGKRSVWVDGSWKRILMFDTADTVLDEMRASYRCPNRKETQYVTIPVDVTLGRLIEVLRGWRENPNGWNVRHT